MTIQTNVLKVILVFAVIFSSQITLASFEYKDHMIANLLISDDSMALKVAGKILEEEVTPNVGLTDLAAIRLLKNYQNISGENIDANAWLIKAIKRSENKRYLALFKDIRSKANIGKIQKYLDDAIPHLTKGKNDDTIDTSSINYTELSTSIRQSLSTKTFPYSHIDSVTRDETVENIYKKLGYPTQISYYIHSKRIPFVGRVKLQDAELIYQGSGSVRLRNIGGDQIVHNTVPEKSPAILTEEIAVVLKNANSARTSILAKKLYKNKDYSQQLLDAAGNKIWLEKDNNDSRMADAAAWLCKYIGASKNSRYHSFLETLMNSTDNKKILKYAKSALSSLPSTHQNNEPFIPGV